MDFTLTEEQKMIQEAAFKFAKNEFPPIATECDREEKYPRDLVTKAAENGLVGVFVPEEYGGAGLGFLDLALVMEQFCRVDSGLALCIAASTFGSENIYFFGSEEQKKTYLPRLTNGSAICAGAYTEPNAGTDVAGYRTQAKKDGSDFILNGNKMFITNGTVCDFMIVACITNPEEKVRHKRMSLLIVDADTPGITRNKLHGKLGIRASDTAEITFEDVRVPQSNLVGQEGKGFYQLMHFFDATRTMVAAQGLGLAQGALDKALEYVQQREVFGQSLYNFQAVQFSLAEMATMIELQRNITYKAAWKIDIGQMDPSLNAMAKLNSGMVATTVADMALQLHGGYGYMDEYDIQRMYRDAKILDIYEGVKEAEKMTIARRLVK